MIYMHTYPYMDYNYIHIIMKYICLSVYLQKQAADLDLSTEVATRLNLVDRETPISLPDTHSAHTAHTRHIDEDIPRLTKVRLNVKCSLAELKTAWIQFISLHVSIDCV